MESDWNITAPSAGHFERLRTQRLALSRALAAVVDRTMALSSWKGDYPIGAAAWANTEKNQVLGGPLNCSTLKELAVQGGGGQGGDSGHSNPNHGSSNNWNRGGGGGTTTSTNPSLSLSQQVVITALQNGIIILYNTLNGNKSPLFVPSDLKTTGSSYSSGGHSGWAVNSSSNNNNAKDDKAVNAIEQTIAANLQYGSLAAVAVAPVAYNKSDLATKVCLAWVLQDAIAVCQIDSAKRDPIVENLHKVAIIPTGLMPSGVILQFSNYFEWGLTSGAAGGGTNNSLPSNADPPAKARMLASVVAESETATSRLSIVLQESDGATTFKPFSSGTNNNNTWGLIHGEVIFAQWLANPKPSQQVLKAALLAERDNNADNNNNHHGGSGYTSRYRNYNNRGYNGNNNNNYRRGGNYYGNRNNNYHNDDDQRRGGDNYEGGGRGGGGGNTTKRYEDYLPSGLQPEGGPALLLLGTSDCRLLLVQVYPIASTLSSSSSSNNKDKDSGSTIIPASNLAWRIVSETLIAHDSPTQHMACFTSSRSTAYGDSANVISMHAAMNVGGGGEEEKSETPSSSGGGAVATSATTSLLASNNKSLTAAALTTSVTTEYVVSYVSMGNVLQNATLEVTWPLLINPISSTNTFNASSSTSSQALGQKREREVDSRTDPRSGHSVPSSSISASPVTSTYPPQHLLHLQPLSSLSTDDYYIQTLSSGVFGHIPVFIIALSTGALIVLDGKSLTALHIFYFERNKHSTLTIPLALVPREQPPMIAVVDDENLTVVKERR